MWKPAFENLLYFRPTIALDWKEQIAAVSTAHGRTSLLLVWEHTTRQAPAELDVDPDCTLTLEQFDDVLELTLSFPTSKGVPSQCVNTMWVHNESTHWRRARMAITALEHMKSDEAKAVLKQLADGHPAAPPTQKAKAAHVSVEQVRWVRGGAIPATSSGGPRKCWRDSSGPTAEEARNSIRLK
ncbi:MAG: hypothetical protein U0996_04935 [Planctomycetaceae bacterium]